MPSPDDRSAQDGRQDAKPVNRGRVEVAVVGSRTPRPTLTYEVPVALADDLGPGTAVEVPLGRRRAFGYVIEPSSGPPPPGLRPIAARVAGASVTAELIELTAWAARYYQVPLPLLLNAVLPPGVRRRTRRHVFPADRSGSDPGPAPEPPLLPGVARAPTPARPLAQQILERLGPAGLDVTQLRSDLGRGVDAAVRRLAAAGRVRVEDVSIERREESHPLLAGDAEADLSRAPRQAAIHAFMVQRRPHPVSRAEIELRFPRSGDAVRRLIARGLLRNALDERRHRPSPDRPAGPPLNEEQAEALSAIERGLDDFATFLLFGVTASGKTEVYLRAAATVRARGRSVLLLVPEIGLTPQLIAQANQRFPGEVAVLHSALPDTARSRTWLDIAAGRSPVVIGARSAVFAPLPDPGLIVVDEEHDAAYKQEESPRYQGRDVAVMRAKRLGIPIVLASATPSLESWQAARSGRYRLLDLPRRATPAPLPSVESIDLRDPAHRFRNDTRSDQPDRPGPLSPPLEEALVENYRAGEQSLLFLNRRGFARFIQCEDCGRVEDCPHCSVSLTLHRSRGIATCHHCGFTRTPRSRCPDCGAMVVGRSFGTEQVESAVRTLLPAARVARLDRDTGGSPGFVEETMGAWRQGELDVLVGTQMIAKGHDAPGVTLIGVILADASLHFPDFRASERTFQLLAQVAGRAGRGHKPGRVLVQTRQPDHPSLIAAAAHDFRAFAAGELRARHELNYPPFGRLARILVEGEAEAVEQDALRLAERLRAAAQATAAATGSGVEVLGPAPAPLERLRGRQRVQILLKGLTSRSLARVLAACQEPRARAGLRVLVDVDPTSMM